MDLYVTGTVMKNRISRELTIAKSSKAFKEMDRGDFKKHLLVYRVGNEAHEAGLVCWKDQDVVYCITNETETTGADECKRRTKNGLITIQRPRVISQYNQHMGGVDLADMRRLHCNSTIMGQNRWWLKLFFYLLDVGTSNSLVLYKLAKGSSADSLSIVEFKELLVQSFLGSRMESIPLVQLLAMYLRRQWQGIDVHIVHCFQQNQDVQDSGVMLQIATCHSVMLMKKCTKLSK